MGANPAIPCLKYRITMPMVGGIPVYKPPGQPSNDLRLKNASHPHINNIDLQRLNQFTQDIADDDAD